MKSIVASGTFLRIGLQHKKIGSIDTMKNLMALEYLRRPAASSKCSRQCMLRSLERLPVSRKGVFSELDSPALRHNNTIIQIPEQLLKPGPGRQAELQPKSVDQAGGDGFGVFISECRRFAVMAIEPGALTLCIAARVHFYAFNCGGKRVRTALNRKELCISKAAKSGR